MREWFATFDGPIAYEFRDLTIAVSEEVAFCHFLSHMSATAAEGGKVAVWNRVTLGLRTIGGDWRVTHVHSSVPFYMDGSYRAAVDLTP
jgi:PhnB protein